MMFRPAIARVPDNYTVTQRMLPLVVNQYLTTSHASRADSLSMLTMICRTYGDAEVHAEIDHQIGVG